MNIWAAIVRIVELFIKGGKPGHALVAFLAAMFAIVIVVAGLTGKSRSYYEAVIESGARATAVTPGNGAK